MRGFEAWLRLALCAVFGLLGGFCVSSRAEPANPRLALVIGASTYPDTKLATPLNDASLIAEVLKSAGFDVTGAADPDQSRFRELLRDFMRKARAAGPDFQAFVYFAGRAVQFEGQNYLVPVDARIDRASDVELEAIRLNDVTRALADLPGLARIFVVDGARANAYARDGRPLAGGLAVTEPPSGVLLGYNAAPGAIGPQPSGAYGVYAKALADQLRRGGVPIDNVFERTRLAVNETTDGDVAPWSVSKLTEPYYMVAQAGEATPEAAKIPPFSTPLKQLTLAEAYDVAVLRDTMTAYQEFLVDFPNAPQVERVRAMLAARREALIWRHTRELNTPAVYWSYLKLYPKGPHDADAERALEALGAATTPPTDFQPVDYGDLGVPSTAELSFAQGSSYAIGAALGPPPAPAINVSLPDENFDWQNPPAPQTTFNDGLPGLPFTVPLLPRTRPFHHRGRPGDGWEGHSAPALPVHPLPPAGPGLAGPGIGQRFSPQRVAPRFPPGASARLAPWRPSLRSVPMVAPMRPFYVAPRLAAPALRTVPLAPLPRLGGPAFHASPALPHFAAPRLAAPAGRL